MPEHKKHKMPAALLKPDPSKHTILTNHPGQPIMQGTGPLDYVCSGCDRALLDGVAQVSFKNCFTLCADCGAYSVPPS